MKNITSKFITVMEYVFGFVGIAMILVESYAVLARNVLHLSTPWTDEALKLLFIWMIFVVSAVEFYSDGLICLTLVEDMEKIKSKPVIHETLKIIQYALAILLNGMLCVQLKQILATQISTGETTTVMKYPLWFLNVGLIVGSVLTIIFGILKIVGCFQNMKQPAQTN